MNLNKYISLAKQNKVLLLPVIALLVVFGYSVIGDLLGFNKFSKSNESAGSIPLEESYINKETGRAANSKITDSEEQRKLIAEEEAAARQKAEETNSSYMRKELINDVNVNDPLYLKNLEESKSKKLKNEIPSECKEDLITKLIICIDKDGKAYLLIDGKKIYLSEELCTQSPYNSLNECTKYMLEKEKERKAKEDAENNKKRSLLDEEERNVDSRGLKNNSKNKNGAGNNSGKGGKEVFGIGPNSSEYQKYNMLLSTIADDDMAGANGRGIGGILVSKEYLNELYNPKNDKTGDKSIKKAKLQIRPGSSYVARLINPVNSLYADQLKPILDITTGDLQGYRLVGEINFSEASNGVIITGNKVVSPNGDEHSVEFTAIRYEGDELTPLFADEIDRHLGGRIGYSILSALTSDYSGMLQTNSVKDTNMVNPGETTAQKSGEVMSKTFDELAEQYVTEVKVNPQNLIVVFY